MSFAVQSVSGLFNSSGLFNPFVHTGVPFVETWFLAQSPLPLLGILASYLVFIKLYGPWIMANRKPLDIKRLVFFYDIVLIVANGWLFLRFARHILSRPNIFCMPVDYTLSPQTLKEATVFWYLLVLKIYELLDSVFFILRKMNNHLSTFHVLHHAMTPLTVWVGLKYFPNGHGEIFCACNTLVHVVMYAYYALASLGPAWKKYLWWKKYLTLLQIGQMALVLMHTLFALVTGCDVSPVIVGIIVFNTLFFGYLFLQFYRQSYSRSGSPKNSKSL